MGVSAAPSSVSECQQNEKHDSALEYICLSKPNTTSVRKTLKYFTLLNLCHLSVDAAGQWDLCSTNYDHYCVIMSAVILD